MTNTTAAAEPFLREYKGWSINFDHPPIPMRGNDWSATSPDYEVDCDEDGFHVVGGQQVHAETYDELVKEIDAAIDDMALTPVACRRCGCGAMAMQMRGQWAVECNNDGTLGHDVAACGAVGPTEATEAEAIAAWNEGNMPTGGAA